MNKITTGFVFSLIFASQGFAQSKQPPVGNYISESGLGDLSIRQGKEGKLEFKLDSSGANDHSCNFDGEIRNGQATLTGEVPCIIDFKASRKGVYVTTRTMDACRSFCGGRAYGFTGLYEKPAPGCQNTERRQLKNEFKHLYDQKKYGKARVKIETILNNCSRTLNWTELGSLRNELAITQYHLGDFSGCLDTLKPYAKNAAMLSNEDALRDVADPGWPELDLPDNIQAPADAMMYYAILKPARTNIKLCRSKLDR